MTNHTDTSRSGDLIYDLRNSKSIGPITQRAAADRIEALEAENERLRERVKQLNEGWNAMGIKGQTIIDRLRAENDQMREALNQALLHRYGDWTDIVRAALGEKQ